MRRNCYALAAFAAAGIPGIIPSATCLISPEGDEIDSALVRDDRDRLWVVTAPTSPASGARVAKEVGVLEALAGTELAPLIQSPQGFASIPDGGRAVIALALEGEPLSFEDVADSFTLAGDLGRVLASVHNTPKYAWSDAGVEEFTVPAIRQSHLDNIRRAHREHTLPSAVLQRWKHLLTDDSLWKFTPRFVHHALNESAVLVAQDSVSGLLHWEDAAVADPARDIAWIIAGLEPEAFDAFFTAYSSHADVRPDARLIERAQLTGEFAVLEWLLAGMDMGDDEIVRDALEMLQDLDDDLADLARREAEHELEDVEEYEHQATAVADESEAPAGADGEGGEDSESRQ